MRIVHYYARYLSHSSGVTHAINNWADQARRFGHDVQIWSAATTTAGTDDYVDVTLSRTIPHLGRGRTSWIPIGLVSRINRNDWLYLHEGWTISNLVAATVGRIKGATVIAMPHGAYEPGITSAMRDFWGIRGRLERLTLRMCHVVHVFYPGEVEVISTFAPRTHRFITVPNGGPDPVEQAPWQGGGDFFVWIGRFDIKHKGLDNLLRFWSLLAQPRPRLVLAGPDHLGGRGVLTELVRDLGLSDDVEIRGRVSGAEKAFLLAESRGYIHPSRWESCSITLLEFLSAGTPCLVSKTVHAADALQPDHVLIAADFESTDADASREAVAALDRNVDLGARARRWATDKGSWPAVGDEYALVLESTAKALSA